MPFKGTMFFGALGRFGWTESWYFGAATAGIAFDDLIAVATRRVTFLGNGCTINRLRMTDTANPGVVITAPFIAPAPPPPAANLTEDTPYNAILVQANDAGFRYRRQMWLRGTIDDWIKFDPDTKAPIINPGMTTQLARFLDALKNALVSIQGINKDPAVAIPRAISAINLDAVSKRFVLTTSLNHGFLEGQQIRISKCKGQNLSAVVNGKTIKVNGVWNAINITPTGFQIALIGDSDTPPLYQGGGIAKIRQPIYPAIAGLRFLNYAKRNTGRPFGLPVGRRMVRR